MLCRAMGAQARFIWNSEGGVWTEIYSEYHGRWIHVDPIGETWDNPMVYVEGKSMSLLQPQFN